MPVIPALVRAALDSDDSPSRFERFCLDIYAATEGVTLVPTSRSWDRGRDGRSIAVGQGAPLEAVLCASLSQDIDEKVAADLTRLAATTTARALVYCCPRHLTEHALDKLEARIRKLLPSAESVRMLSQDQLVALAISHEDVTRKAYGAELLNLESALLAPPAGAKPEAIGLRLALMAQTGDDARALRSSISRRLVLESLDGRGPATAGAIAAVVSQLLHLPRALSADYIASLLSNLKDEGLVSLSLDNKWTLSEAGADFLGEVSQDASIRLLEGRAAVKAAITRLSGHSLSADQYDRVWNTMQDGLADLFYAHGASIVEMVAAVLSGEARDIPRVAREHLERLGDRVAALFSDPVQGQEVRQATIDMFGGHDSEAGEWLTETCCVFVMMCSLGFESLSAAEVSETLRHLRLIADSDIVLSLLCPGESNHEEIRALLPAWRALGGKVSVAVPVLEEVAYHAWISDSEFRAISELFGSRDATEISHLVQNAFVRAFVKVAGEKRGPREWMLFVREYRGASERDYGRISTILAEEYGFGVLPPADEAFAEFSQRVQDFLASRIAVEMHCEPDDLDYRVLDKCRRDGALLAAIRAARERARESGSREVCLVLSSASGLKDADRTFRRDLGEPEAVFSSAALACLVTLTPGVKMGLGSLRAVLFDMGLRSRLGPLTRYAYRLIEASGEYSLPWSRRVTLQRQLQDRLLADARAEGLPVRELRERVLRSARPEHSAHLLRETLENMAVKPKSTDELMQLREEVARLREQLAVEQAAPPGATAAPPRKGRRRPYRR